MNLGSILGLGCLYRPFPASLTIVELLLWGKLLEDISMEALARQPRKLLNDPSDECVLLLVSRWPCSSCRKRCPDPDPRTPDAPSA